MLKWPKRGEARVPIGAGLIREAARPVAGRGRSPPATRPAAAFDPRHELNSSGKDRSTGYPLDAIEQRLANAAFSQIIAGDLGHGLVHGQVVLAGGNDEVDLGHQSVAIDLVIVEQGAAR